MKTTFIIIKGWGRASKSHAAIFISDSIMDCLLVDSQWTAYKGVAINGYDGIDELLSRTDHDSFKVYTRDMEYGRILVDELKDRGKTVKHLNLLYQHG